MTAINDESFNDFIFMILTQIITTQRSFISKKKQAELDPLDNYCKIISLKEQSGDRNFKNRLVLFDTCS